MNLGFGQAATQNRRQKPKKHISLWGVWDVWDVLERFGTLKNDGFVSLNGGFAGVPGRFLDGFVVLI